jgi:integrase
MPRPVTGELRTLANGYEARIRIDDEGNRKGFGLTAIRAGDKAAGVERCTAMAQMALRLRRAGHADDVEELMKMAARARAGKPWEHVVAAVDLLCGGRTTENGPSPITFKELGEQWRDGDLHRRFRDHVVAKKEKSISRDEEIARIYVDPELGETPVADVTLEDCERVMALIPETKSPALRRAVAVYMSRLLRLSVYPLRLRNDHPIPRGWLPRVPNDKAKECLYPDEDRKLLASSDAPLIRRLFFGMGTREGMRTDEQGSLLWRDVDLERGRIVLDENKTDDPRDWDLEPGVWRALQVWKERYCPDAEPDDHVFAENGVPISINLLAYHLRRDLKKAGVTREKLFERSAVRRPIRAHDLRATFVTVALATGKTETFVKDRTGHRSASMLERYRRKARGWNMGPLDALDEAIPELASAPHERPTELPARPTSEPLDREFLEGIEIAAEVLPDDSAVRIACNSKLALRPFSSRVIDRA